MNTPERKETAREIIDEIRRKGDPCHYTEAIGSSARVSYQDMKDYAERLEDAISRETANVAKLREALEAMVAFWGIHGGAYSVRVCPVRDNPEEVEAERVSVMARGKAALAAPPRNCDVGTAEEQAERFELFCDAKPTCAGCPCGLHPSPSCGVAWAQMRCLPYEAPAAQEGGQP